MSNYHLFPDDTLWTVAREYDERFVFESEEDALAGCSEIMRERPGILKLHLSRDSFEQEFSSRVQQVA